MKKNPKIHDLNKCDDLGNKFLLKKSKNPLISLCRSLKISGNKKYPKILDPQKCENPGNNFFFFKSKNP